jgi:hypothetical protein
MKEVPEGCSPRDYVTSLRLVATKPKWSENAKLIVCLFQLSEPLTKFVRDGLVDSLFDPLWI